MMSGVSHAQRPPRQRLRSNGVLGNFELHDWSCTQSYGTACRIQVLKLSPKAHHFSIFVIWGSWSRRMPGLGYEIVLATTRSRRSPLFKLFSPPLGFLLIADEYKQLEPAEPACFLVM